MSRRINRRGASYETRRVFLRMKSIRMNCPKVIVFVKEAFPRQIAETFFTNSTRLRSRASMRQSQTCNGMLNGLAGVRRGCMLQRTQRL